MLAAALEAEANQCIAELVLPLLYLHGLSSGDFVPALEQFFGSAADSPRPPSRG